MAGGTGHADIVPVDVLEKDLSVPPCQGAGLRETRCEAPHISPSLVGARDLRHWRRGAGDEVSGAPGEQSPGEYSSSSAGDSLTLLSSKEKLPVPLPFPSQTKPEISHPLTTTC